jgi:hypothetical protein
MAGNAFGFSQYPQRPTVDPKTVGKALVQKKLQGQGGAPLPPSPAPVRADATRVSPPWNIGTGTGPMNGIYSAPSMQEELGFPGPGGLQRRMIPAGVSPAHTPMPLEAMMPRENPFDETEDAFVDPFAGRDGGDQHEDSAIQAARHEARRRVGMALEQGQQRTPAPAGNEEQLRRLGISPAELRLMRAAGVTK